MNTTGNKHIGDKTTFWKLLKEDYSKNVLIPTIQRDYTYGSKIYETEKVLDKMLEDIKNALFKPNNPELSMNFIYGYTQDKINYVPLDGQQRLTTLYLLHYYAALYNSDADFDTLKKFSYATRETTKNYCECIISNHDRIIEELINGKRNIKEAIEDLPWYIPDFEYDPSIRSMQVVLERIQNEFDDVKYELWEKLTADNCPVNFYILDFGTFGLSDDLYVKMNARGKKLTEYEIFKSMFLKHIEVNLNAKALQKEIALKFDNSWTDLIWGCFQKENLKAVDDAYIRLLKLVFRLLSGLKEDKDYIENPNLDSKSIEDYLTDTDDIKFIASFIDTFNNKCRQGKGNYEVTLRSEIRDLISNDIKTYTKYINIFIRCIEGFNVTNAELLIVYAQYLAFKLLSENKTDIEQIRINMRHLRNLVENSNDEIRAANMHFLLKGVELVIKGKMDRNDTYKFNKNQWHEECEKHEHIDNWKKLWKYEEHSILRGALSVFWDDQKPNLSDDDILNKVIKRLDKFSYVFSTPKIDVSHTQEYYNDDDKLIRAALLTVKDYSQSPKARPEYKIIGNMPACWRLMFVKSEQRINQKTIIDVIDTIDVQGDVKEQLQGMIDSYLENPNKDTRDWHYYAIKYKDFSYKSNMYSNRYGYFYDYSVRDANKTNSIEIAMLQSTQFGTSNRAWYLLPFILFSRNKDKYDLFMGDHAANEEESYIRFTIDSNEYLMNIWCEGWRIYGMSKQFADETGIPCEEKIEEDFSYLLCSPAEHEDFIEWAEENILKQLEKVPGFKK